MKVIIHCILAILLCCLNEIHGQIRCSAAEDKLFNIGQEYELDLQDWIKANMQNELQSRSVITIPVVVHIVWNQPEENIPDDQIYSQIEILNQDFRAANSELADIPAVFQPLIADTEIEFCLAKVDPDGNLSTGITRKFTSNPVGIGGTTAIHYSDQGGTDAWDTDKYLNIWVAKFAGNVGGTGSFPGQGAPEEDGVEVNYLQFGNINVAPPYHLGRTLTHEIGHYLNLEHPWGPSITDCCEDDFVLDTPEACETYLGDCPTHPVISCSEPDLFMNFMFYSDDACLSMFTLGQKIRMLATLNTLRVGLLTGSACEPVEVTDLSHEDEISIFPNPVYNELYLQIQNSTIVGPDVTICDIAGKSMITLQNHSIANGIDISSLNKGVYYLMIKNDQKIWMEKFVKL